jgi:hypothetical protein
MWEAVPSRLPASVARPILFAIGNQDFVKARGFAAQTAA